MDGSYWWAAVCAAALVAGCANPAQKYNQRGVALFNAGQYQAALQQFQFAAGLNLTSPDLYYNLGRTYHQLGQPAAAEINYDHCLALDPNHTKCRHAQVVFLLEQGRGGEAYQVVKRWMAQSPRSPDPLVELAWLERQTGRAQEAQQHLQQALALAPTHSRALAELGAMYEQQGRPQRALVVYQRALEANPGHIELAGKVATLRSRLAASYGNDNCPPATGGGAVLQAGKDLRYPLRR